MTVTSLIDRYHRMPPAGRSVSSSSVASGGSVAIEQGGPRDVLRAQHPRAIGTPGNRVPQRRVDRAGQEHAHADAVGAQLLGEHPAEARRRPPWSPRRRRCPGMARLAAMEPTLTMVPRVLAQHRAAARPGSETMARRAGSPPASPSQSAGLAPGDGPEGRHAGGGDKNVDPAELARGLLDERLDRCVLGDVGRARRGRRRRLANRRRPPRRARRGCARRERHARALRGEGASATARPMPRPAPVTMATCPASAPLTAGAPGPT